MENTNRQMQAWAAYADNMGIAPEDMAGYQAQDMRAWARWQIDMAAERGFQLADVDITADMAAWAADDIADLPCLHDDCAMCPYVGDDGTCGGDLPVGGDGGDDPAPVPVGVGDIAQVIAELVDGSIGIDDLDEVWSVAGAVQDGNDVIMTWADTRFRIRIEQMLDTPVTEDIVDRFFASDMTGYTTIIEDAGFGVHVRYGAHGSRVVLTFPGETPDNPHMWLGEATPGNIADAIRVWQRFIG